MAATDARPVPRKNAAFRFYFAIRKNDGTLITTWAGADSEVSIDGASFSDCTNEATEIGTTGVGYIDLTSSEMNGDAVVYKLTVTNTGALPLVVTFFPEEAGDYRADVTHFGGSAGTFSGGRPEVNATHLAGTAYASADLSATMKASVNTEVDTGLADYDAPTKAEMDLQFADLDTLLGTPAGASVSADIAALAAAIVVLDNFLDTEIADILTDTGTDIPALIAALNNLSAAQVNAEVVDALATDTYAEPSGTPAATIALTAKIGWIYMALRNKLEVTSSAKTFFDDAGNAEWKKALSDDGTTYGEAEASAP